MEKYFARITQTQALLIGLLIAGVYFISAYDDGTALMTQKDQVQAEVRQLEVDLTNMKKSIEQAQQYEKLAKDKGDKFLQLTRFLPKDFDRKEQMRMIAQEARLAAMEPSLSEGGAGSGKKFEFFEEQEVDANIKGTFIKLMVFLSNLTKGNRVLGVRSLNLQSEARNYADGTETKAPTLNIQIKFVGYRYIASEKDKDTAAK